MLSREAHSIFVPFFSSQLEVDLPRFIRSSLVFAALVACRSRSHGSSSSSFLLPGWSHSRASLISPTRALFSFEVRKKKFLIFIVRFFFSESGFLPVRVVFRVTCVVLCCLGSLFVLNGSVKSSGLQVGFGRVVFLCCLPLFQTSASGSFPWAYAVRPSLHPRCSPGKGLQS